MAEATCKHPKVGYRAEYVFGLVMLRDYLLCRDCGSQYSIVWRKWVAASPTPETGTP